MLRTIAIVTAQVAPDKAQQALHRLIEETFPEHKIDREKSVEKALAIMEKEKAQSYSVVPVGQSLRGTPMDKLRSMLKGKGSRRRR
jgi:N-acetylglutamate synthase/N-acetylornithine aminotransferase